MQVYEAEVSSDPRCFLGPANRTDANVRAPPFPPCSASLDLLQQRSRATIVLSWDSSSSFHSYSSLYLLFVHLFYCYLLHRVWEKLNCDTQILDEEDLSEEDIKGLCCVAVLSMFNVLYLSHALLLHPLPHHLLRFLSTNFASPPINSFVYSFISHSSLQMLCCLSWIELDRSPYVVSPVTTSKVEKKNEEREKEKGMSPDEDGPGNHIKSSRTFLFCICSIPFSSSICLNLLRVWHIERKQEQKWLNRLYVMRRGEERTEQMWWGEVRMRRGREEEGKRNRIEDDVIFGEEVWKVRLFLTHRKALTVSFWNQFNSIPLISSHFISSHLISSHLYYTTL